ncbi:uncharacterized protein PG998_013535 [Apiospora kogelbergensis]|uniref:uncharacterized protein n=1 Tax=Apiospora kogelbergensis TaxID=1337665 RepID=UPI0031316D7B
MAQCIAVSDQDTRWNIGMPLPLGGPPPTYRAAGRVVTVGKGQLTDPAAQWMCDLPEEHEKNKKAAIEDIVQRVAVQVGATHVWIRSRVHNYGYVYDKYGNRVPIVDESGKFVEWKMIRKDNHITAAFGTSTTHVNVHGHIYVTTDVTGSPTGFMDVGSRKYVCNGDVRILELWKQTERRPQHSGRDANVDRPEWQDEVLMDHYCPCPHADVRPGDDHYCPCPHVQAVGLDHWCPNNPCPHDQYVLMRREAAF